MEIFKKNQPSAYEIERQRIIRKNYEFIKSCGLPVKPMSANNEQHHSTVSDVPFFPCLNDNKTVTENKEPNVEQNDKRRRTKETKKRALKCKKGNTKDAERKAKTFEKRRKIDPVRKADSSEAISLKQTVKIECFVEKKELRRSKRMKPKVNCDNTEAELPVYFNSLYDAKLDANAITGLKVGIAAPEHLDIKTSSAAGTGLNEKRRKIDPLRKADTSKAISLKQTAKIECVVEKKECRRSKRMKQKVNCDNTDAELPNYFNSLYDAKLDANAITGLKVGIAAPEHLDIKTSSAAGTGLNEKRRKIDPLRKTDTSKAISLKQTAKIECVFEKKECRRSKRMKPKVNCDSTDAELPDYINSLYDAKLDANAITGLKVGIAAPEHLDIKTSSAAGTGLNEKRRKIDPVRKADSSKAISLKQTAKIECVVQKKECRRSKRMKPKVNCDSTDAELPDYINSLYDAKIDANAITGLKVGISAPEGLDIKTSSAAGTGLNLFRKNAIDQRVGKMDEEGSSVNITVSRFLRRKSAVDYNEAELSDNDYQPSQAKKCERDSEHSSAHVLPSKVKQFTVKSKSQEIKTFSNEGGEIETSEPNKLFKHKDTRSKNRLCDICGKLFASLYDLKVHVRTHTGERPYKCNYCGKRFSQSCTVKTHKRIHTREKPYACGICGKVFNQLGNMQSHQRTHTGQKPYACNKCGKVFTQLANLQSHQRTHTGQKPYACNKCGKVFTQLANLQSHQRTHTGQKPYACNKCGKVFTQLANLQSHQRTHTGQKPYACDSCGEKFRQLSGLQRHQHSHVG